MAFLALFAGVAVSDYPRAVTWFEALLGCPATFAATDTECVWELAEDRSLYVVLRPGRAGQSMLTTFVDDLDGFVHSAAGRGVRPVTQETYGNGVRKVTFRDPDGNEIGFGAVPTLPGDP